MSLRLKDQRGLQGRSRFEIRQGATTVEVAIVLPVTIMLTLGLIVWGMGMFRYHQVADLSRAASRYAITHGGAYTQEGHGEINKQQIIDAAISPRAGGLSSQAVAIQVVTFDGTAYDWDDDYWNNHNRTYDLQTDIGTGTFNRVRVTVSHDWFPEVFGVGPIKLMSTSEMQMAY